MFLTFFFLKYMVSINVIAWWYKKLQRLSHINFIGITKQSKAHTLILQKLPNKTKPIQKGQNNKNKLKKQ